ncbi:MAG: DNA cytosine methyltransferase, partial [Candidatus Electrothrix sp. ATG2]|nr:DNA cytosine methyltransferase [Candidatus Electrothrix sp. ATG2]
MSIRVFDFFSGCGGTSLGFANAGCNIEFSLDIDRDAISTFKKNFPNAESLCADITQVDPSYLLRIIEYRDDPLLFCGCAPCQPFSKQNRQKKQQDPRKNLLLEFSKFIIYWKPEFLMIENVPGLQK